MANLPPENVFNISIQTLQQRLVELDIQIENVHQEILALRVAFCPLNSERPQQQLLDVEERYQQLSLEREDVRDQIDNLIILQQQQGNVPQQMEIQQQPPPEIDPQQLGVHQQPPQLLQTAPQQMEIQQQPPPEIDPQQLGVHQQPSHLLQTVPQQIGIQQQPQRRIGRQGRQRPRETHRKENIGETSEAGVAHKRTRQS